MTVEVSDKKPNTKKIEGQSTKSQYGKKQASEKNLEWVQKQSL